MSTAAPLLENSSDFERKLRKNTAVIYIAAWVGCIFSITSLAITGAVLFTSTTLSSDKKVFFASVLLVCGLALQLVVFISRHRSEALLLFTQLSCIVCALTLGLAIPYAS